MLELKRRAGLAAWQHILPPDVLHGPGMPDRWVAAVRSPGPRSAVLVAELNGAVVGFAITGPSLDGDATPDTGELDGLYTDPDAWRAGAGRALLEAATARLRSDGFATATLWTAAENHRPRRIYELAGWATDRAERRRNLGGTEFSELRYRRPLS